MGGFRRIFPGILVCLLVLPLAGCDPTSRPAYEISYPSGYARDPYTREELAPVEGSACQLRYQKAEDYEKSFLYDLQILDESGNLLFAFPGLGSPTMRGETGWLPGTLWVCSETWNTPHLNGYMNNTLTGSTLLLIDSADGEILFQGECPAHELYLLSAGSRCYFYTPGVAARETFFGLVHTPARNAEIFYRDIAQWEQRHPVYTFDFVGKPPPVEGADIDRMIFYPGGDTLRVALTEYRQVDKASNHWDYIELDSYEISLTGI